MQKKAKSGVTGTSRKLTVKKQALKDLSAATRDGGIKGGAKKRAQSIIITNTSYE